MIVCFDIGGTTIKGAYVQSPIDIRFVPKVPTPIDDFELFVASLRDICDCAPEKPEAISLSLAAVSDPDTGTITCANIPCIDRRILKSELESRLNCPVTIANDADCFAIAEAGFGAGREHDIVLGIILGTGVGGGLVVNGRLANASGGFAGEWGHGQTLATSAGTPLVVIPQLYCGCGQKGCVDTFGASRGLERLHTHLSDETLTSEDLLALWRTGESKALRTLDIYLELISAPLAFAVNITGASMVPVGGGLSNVAELIGALDAAVRARTLRKFNRSLIVRAECNPEPGLIGAALNGFQFLERYA